MRLDIRELTRAKRKKKPDYIIINEFSLTVGLAAVLTAAGLAVELRSGSSIV